METKYGGASQGSRFQAFRVLWSHHAVAYGVILVLSASGCAVGPNYKTPERALPNRYTETALPEHTVSSPVAHGVSQHLNPGQDIPGDWWTLYRSEPLTHLVALAIRNNPNLESARQALRNAQELTLAQYSGLLPAVGGTFGRTRGNFPFAPSGQPNTSMSYGYYDAHLGLSYNFDVWGKTRRLIEQQEAEADYQRAYFEAVLLTLTGNVVATAINEASLRGQIAAQMRLIAIERDYLTMLQQQFSLGGANGTDVALQEAQLAQQEAELPQMENGLAQARNAMAAYLGALPADTALPQFDLSDLTLPTEVPVALPSDLVRHRPDIRQADGNLHAATAAVGVAIANRLPQFTLTGDLGSQAARAGQLMTPGNGLATLATQVTMPIFEGGNLLHQQRAAVATMRDYAAQWQNTVVGAFQDVANALMQIQNDSRQLSANLLTEQAAARALDLARRQYRLGGVSYLTVLSSEIIYQQAAIALVQARAARLSDTSALLVALGGGWWNRQDVPPPPPGVFESLMPWSKS